MTIHPRFFHFWQNSWRVDGVGVQNRLICWPNSQARRLRVSVCDQPGMLSVNSLITMCLGETGISECSYTRKETAHTHAQRTELPHLEGRLPVFPLNDGILCQFGLLCQTYLPSKLHVPQVAVWNTVIVFCAILSCSVFFVNESPI